MTSEINLQDWQQNFISTNLIAIGYNSWLGYLNAIAVWLFVALIRLI